MLRGHDSIRRKSLKTKDLRPAGRGGEVVSLVFPRTYVISLGIFCAIKNLFFLWILGVDSDDTEYILGASRGENDDEDGKR